MKNRQTLIAVVGYMVGAIGGFVYYNLFPCETGCTITSSPFITMLIGAFIGGFVFQLINEMFFVKS
jgi:hypothetical protein